MNTKNLIIAISFVFGFFMMSCDKDDTISKPVVNILELGMENGRVAYVGADLHVEAEIVAEGKIDKVTIEIHQEEASSDEVVAVYNDYAGLKNVTLHKHVDIPADAKPGVYLCHIIVTDMEGNQMTEEAEITILAAE
ncbi:uncharacterized protein DUF4625 [Breznakibacter xylanolyticus]|uniref:Uncharacterized protein DUF4625 n=1 Tax=Breznakibacter xylanolyticus TaxID=990 RepID=A0A2W7NK72_9BACT|nr:DUF4625 domain-containing protein [Breznakibacter xylanolyticus]PZX20260.1 uncharacterized protein DUF4625 [Breznakibacter xylanolyticus]